MRAFVFPIPQVIFVFAIIGILTPTNVVGQTTSNYSAITGRVMDGTGAVLRGATVRLYSDPQSKTALAETTTNAEGEYRISASAGTYTLSVSADGFQTTNQEIQLSTNQRHSQDIALPIETISQSIIVTCERVYAAPESTTGTKIETPLLETPMAVQVVPRQVIEDRQASTTEEVVKNASGIQAGQNLFYDQFMVRGFYSGYGTTFRNGLQLRSLNEVENIAFVDHVEVIKGPSPMLYGRVEPGGFVNIVTKKPLSVGLRELPMKSLSRSIWAISAWVLLAGVLAGCNTSPRHYTLRGHVLGKSAATEQLTVNHENIPGFMAAMTMPYSVKDSQGLANAQPGDMITADVVVTKNSDYWLEHIAVTDKTGRGSVTAIAPHERLPGKAVPDVPLINQDGKTLTFSRQRLSTLDTFPRRPFPPTT
jgi:Cu/Ag efflux protein CusF